MNKEFKKSRLALPTISADTREILLDIATLLVALGISGVKFFFSTYPFGLAFCSACKRRTPFAVAGAVIGSLLFIDSFVPYLVAFLSLIAIRLVGSVWLGDDGQKRLKLGEGARPAFIGSLFSERISVRVAICALCALGLGVYRVISSGFTYYDIFVVTFSVVFVSILCYALSGAFEKSEPSSSALGIGAILFMVVFALRGKEIFSLDVSIILSYGAILFASWRVKGAHSVALGTILGICHGVAFAPVFAIGALVSYVLFPFSLSFSMVGALVLSLGYGILSSGYEAIVYLLPEILFASLIMYPLNKFKLIPLPKFIERNNRSTTEIVHSVKANELKGNLSRISASFSEISSMLSELSAKSKSPDRDFYKDMCLETLEKYCFSCPKRSICWERDTLTTRENISKMANESFASRMLTLDAVDEKFLHRCPNIEKVTDEINEAKRKIASSGIKSDKLEISAQDYEIIAKLIDDLGGELDELYTPNGQATQRVKDAIRSLPLIFENVEAFGSSALKITFSGVDITNSSCTLTQIKDTLEASLDINLTEPVLCEADGVELLTLKSDKTLKIDHFSNLSESSDDENGDTLCAFSTSNDKFYMLLCDGMGSGRGAHLTSSICAEFLEKILSSCQSKELCLTMLNNLIRAKSLECSSSVDLLEVDLVSGEASLTKSGAAPSFIKRGGNVFRLHSKTAPIGIMKSLDAERLDFSLREGDIVVMVSDGIASDERDSKYLVDFLSKVEIVENDDFSPTSPDSLSEKELITPANASNSSSPFASPKRQDALAPTRLSLSSLPEAIISLAKSRLNYKADDMSVGVALVGGTKSE